MLKELLEFGAEGCCENSKDGMTPLLYGVQREDIEICELLLRFGADPNQKSSHKLM
jgi:ankyrin repeat protein